MSEPTAERTPTRSRYRPLLRVGLALVVIAVVAEIAWLATFSWAERTAIAGRRRSR